MPVNHPIYYPGVSPDTRASVNAVLSVNRSSQQNENDSNVQFPEYTSQDQIWASKFNDFSTPSLFQLDLLQLESGLPLPTVEVHPATARHNDPLVMVTEFPLGP